jgi:hypothetical protein
MIIQLAHLILLRYSLFPIHTFIHQTTIKMSDFTTEAFTLLGVGISLIFLRTYARLSTVGLSGLKGDDYIMLLASVVYSLETAAAYSVGAIWHGLANSGMTDAERYALSLTPDSEEVRMRIGGSKTQVVGWSLYTLLLWLLKLAMCIFYIRLTEGVDHMKMRIRVGLGLIGVTYVATILSILLGCHPMEKNWQIYPDPGSECFLYKKRKKSLLTRPPDHCQPAISKIDIYVTVVLNVVTDMYLLSIPLPMLFKANLPFRRKLLLIVMFGGGIFVTMAGILRCVLILTNPVTGAQQAGSWAVRETFVAVVTSNIPMIYPLLRRWYTSVTGSKLVTTMMTNNKYGQTTGSSSRHGGPGGGKSGHSAFEMDKKSHRGPRSVNPITMATFAESEERIVGVQGAPSSSSIHQPEHNQDSNLPLSNGHRSHNIGVAVGRTSRDRDEKRGIEVTTETEIEVQSVDSRTRRDDSSYGRDMHGHYDPDGRRGGARGYGVGVYGGTQ